MKISVLRLQHQKVCYQKKNSAEISNVKRVRITSACSEMSSKESKSTHARVETINPPEWYLTHERLEQFRLHEVDWTVEQIWQQIKSVGRGSRDNKRGLDRTGGYSRSRCPDISEGQRSPKLTSVSPESTSSREMRLCPSLRSSYRSVMCLWACGEKTGDIF